MHKRKGNETHQKIYSAIKQLLEQKNAAEISVQDICQCAGIGVGTFYHYYPSKNAAIYDISNPIDEYFELKVAPELDGKTPLEQLRFFFYHQAMFMIQFVLANGSQEPLNYLIMSQQHFFSKNRTTYQMLYDIISNSNLYPNWFPKYSYEKITEHLLHLSRGAINSWLGYKCTYDLIEDIWSYIEMTLPDVSLE